MNVTIQPASTETFQEIASWRYDPPYDFYNGDEDPVLNPERFYEALADDGSLVGYFYFEEKGAALEIGLGLRPELAGRGLGLEFFRAGVEFGRRRFGPERVVLNVAAFNRRAIAVYERAGFREVGRHHRHFERWGEVEFVDMEEAGEPR